MDPAGGDVAFYSVLSGSNNDSTIRCWAAQKCSAKVGWAIPSRSATASLETAWGHS